MSKTIELAITNRRSLTCHLENCVALLQLVSAGLALGIRVHSATKLLVAGLKAPDDRRFFAPVNAFRFASRDTAEPTPCKAFASRRALFSLFLPIRALRIVALASPVLSRALLPGQATHIRNVGFDCSIFLEQRHESRPCLRESILIFEPIPRQIDARCCSCTSQRTIG